MSDVLTRRKLLWGAGGLVIAVALPQVKSFSQRPRARLPLIHNAYIHIGSDDAVTFVIAKGEMGQGTVTSLSMILADELDCDWARVRTEFAPVDASVYGPMQGVFGSTSIRTMWTPMRQAGATARALLMQAAAEQWKIDQSQIRTENGRVIGPSAGMQANYGSLADAAIRLPVPPNVPVKDPKTFKLIGTPVKRLDTRDKVCGATRFGIDAEVPGMLYAVTVRCPVFGGKAASFDATKSKGTPGVKDVVQIPNGIAVIAEDTWSAMQGRRALSVQWDEGPNAGLNSETIRARMAALAAQPGAVAKTVGDAAGAMATAAKKLEAVYEAPFLAHACMEPLNCTASVKADSCEIWASMQMQTGAQQKAAEITGLKREQIHVNSMFMGGGFGRRRGVDFIGEAVEIAKAAGVPVKLTWMREDDIQNGPFRPAAYVRFGGAVDAEGWPVAFTARVVCPSFFGRGDGVDGIAVEGVDDLEYKFPNFHVEYQKAGGEIPTSFWRSVGYSQNTFFSECFLDEMAAAGGKDPLEVRRRLLKESPRALHVLNLAAEQMGWGNPPPGRFQGLALVNNIGSFTAEVAEIEIQKGKLRVHRVVCAVDCGRVVNPAIVRQQMESGIVYGLTAALKGAITIDKGRVQQSNFDRYEMLRIDEMPKIEVHIARSEDEPGGIGEASVPPIAPAVANAIFAATGKRIRRLPIQVGDFA
jgi:isoquinoline 1-oxidoreductase beta subunit